jgi:bacteriorhodopsin
MEILSTFQFELVHNLFSLTVATMFASGLFFFASRDQVERNYRPALLVSSLVVFIAGYHYLRIWQSWGAAYVPSEEGFIGSGIAFNDAYRYADWLLTVPLLLVELVAVLALAKAESGPMLKKLVIAAILMIAFGYPGEVATDAGTKWIWWVAAMIPYLYILGALFTKLGPIIAKEDAEVGGLISLARTVLLVTWLFYPISYLAPVLGLDGASGETALQVGYTIADITAKAGYGLVIYMIAKAKSDRDRAKAGLPA